MLLWTIISLFLFPKTLALYEDQIGKFDWRHQYTGKAKFILFDTSTAAIKKVITATEQNVIASINAKTGQIVWRQILERSESSRIDDIKLKDGNLVAVLGGGTYVRCLTAAVGDVMWEYNVDGASTDKTATLLLNNEFVYILAGDKVVAYNSDDLETEWTVQLSDKSVASHQYISLIGNDIVVAGVAPGSHMAVTTISTDGAVKKSATVPALWSSADTKCAIASDSYLMCIDNNGGALQLLDLKLANVFKATYLQELGLEAKQATFQTRQSDDTQYVILRLEPVNSAVVTVEGGTVLLVKLLAGAQATQVLSHNDRQLIMDVVKYAPNTMQGSAFDVDTGAAVDDLTVKINFADHHGTPSQVYGLSFRKRDGTPVIKLLLLSEDHSMVMLHSSGKLAWTREEALASIVSVEMVDFPVSPILAKMEDEFSGSEGLIGMFVKRFTTQFLQIKEFILSLKNKILLPRHHHHSNLEGDVVVTSREEDKDDYLTRDEFNLHKMLTVVTSAGKIFGLLSDGGKPEWKHFLPDITAFRASGSEKLPLFVQRTTAHFPLTPIATVIGKHKVTGQTVVYTFDPITGQPVEGMAEGGEVLDCPLKQVIMLTQMSDAFVRPVVVLDENLKYHTIPSSLSSMVTLNAPSLFMFSCDVTAGSLTGFNMRTQDEELIAQDLWTVNLHRETQHITHVVGKHANEHVHSHGVVLGDRSVLYKYINPNLVVVAAEGVDNQAKNFINVYLVDAVTGHIAFHCHHKRARGPTHVVHSEHWIVYTYWNEKHRRQELGVIELYEGPQQSNSTAFSSLAPPPPPIVMRQSYIINAHVTAAHQTITEKGITNKQVILALEMGGILGMPKMFLDARRPLIPSQESREEGLLPYMPEVPVAYEMLANYNQSVHNIRGIHTAPSGLESTSLVLCYGLDLFFTRVTPSKMFDVLKEDFEYLFIAAVLAGMVLVSVLTRKLAQRKALNKAWK